MENMINKLKIKFEGYSFLREVSISATYAILFNLIILMIAFFVSKSYFVNYNFTTIYYGALVGLLAIYATVIAISTNLAQDFPLEISLKYIVKSTLSLSYLSILGLNIVFLNILFLFGISVNYGQLMLMISTILLILLTIFFIPSFMNKFRLKYHLGLFFEDMRKEIKGYFTLPRYDKFTPRYYITEKEDFYLITSKDFKKGVLKSEFDFNIKNMKSKNVSSGKVSKEEIPNKILPIYIGKGKAKVIKWEFLDKAKIPIKITINKYEFGEDFLSPQILCEYSPLDIKDKDLDNLKRDILLDIAYRDFNKEEFKSVFNKLKKNGTESKLIDLIKKHISEEKNLSERRFLFSSFENFFKESKYEKPNLDLDGILEIEINNLYEQKRLFFDSPVIIAKLQDKLTNILIINFDKFNRLNRRLDTSGLYIKEFLDIRYLDKYEENDNEIWDRQYEFLIENTLKNIFSLCRNLVDMDIKDDLKVRYLSSQLGYFNTILEHIRISENMGNKKKDFIEKLKKKLIEKEIELLFFDLALKIYELPEIKASLKETFNPLSFETLEWLNYNQIQGGAQSIPWFNYNRYRLLLQFHNFINFGDTGINKLTKENFTGSILNLEGEIKIFSKSFAKQYYDFTEKQFVDFKKTALNEVKQKKKEVLDLEEEYIINSQIKGEYVNQFKKDCRREWEDDNRDLAKIFDIEIKEKDDKKKIFFGQHTLFPKDWFLDSFDKNISLSRTTGGDFGGDQGRSKYKEVLKKVASTFRKSKGDKTINIKELYDDLSKNIKNGKIYYLFYTGRKIYDLPNIEWLREGVFVAKIKINKSEIYFCHSIDSPTLLFEKGAFTLKQYLNDKKEELTVEIEEEFSEEEIKKILKSSKNLKSKKDILKNVKIKVQESFEVKRNKGYKLIKLTT